MFYFHNQFFASDVPLISINFFVTSSQVHEDTHFFYKNSPFLWERWGWYEICPNFKNMLRTSLSRLRVSENILLCSFVFVVLWTSVFNAFCKVKFTKSWLARHLVRGIRASRTSMWWGSLVVKSVLIYWNIIQCDLRISYKNVFRLKSPKNKNAQSQLYN